MAQWAWNFIYIDDFWKYPYFLLLRAEAVENMGPSIIPSISQWYPTLSLILIVFPPYITRLGFTQPSLTKNQANSSILTKTSFHRHAAALFCDMEDPLFWYYYVTDNRVSVLSLEVLRALWRTKEVRASSEAKKHKCGS